MAFRARKQSRHPLLLVLIALLFGCTNNNTNRQNSHPGAKPHADINVAKANVDASLDSPDRVGRIVGVVYENEIVTLTSVAQSRSKPIELTRRELNGVDLDGRYSDSVLIERVSPPETGLPEHETQLGWNWIGEVALGSSAAAILVLIIAFYMWTNEYRADEQHYRIERSFHPTHSKIVPLGNNSVIIPPTKLSRPDPLTLPAVSHSPSTIALTEASNYQFPISQPEIAKITLDNVKEQLRNASKFIRCAYCGRTFGKEVERAGFSPDSSAWCSECKTESSIVN